MIGTKGGTGDGTGIGLIPGLPTNPGPPINIVTTTPDAPKAPVMVSEGTELALLIHRVEPIYPRIATLQHLEGTVQLRAIIASDGSIQHLEIVSGPAILALAAKEAVQQWRFRPTLLNGKPVEVATYVTVVFHMNQQ